jgi:hypothetical protein
VDIGTFSVNLATPISQAKAQKCQSFSFLIGQNGPYKLTVWRITHRATKKRQQPPTSAKATTSTVVAFCVSGHHFSCSAAQPARQYAQ